MARQLIACKAKCRSCQETFLHPGIIDASYGEMVLSSPDGVSYVLASAFGPFPERVGTALSSKGPGRLWKVLAAMADHGPSGPYMTTMRCPHCRSDDLEYWNGKEAGTVLVPEATYAEYERLDDGELARQVASLT
jgi:hypothetical protein